MLNLVPQPNTEEVPVAYAEAISRLASVRHALRLVEPFAGGPASDVASDDAMAVAWDGAGERKQRLFDRRSARLVGTSATAVEALLGEHKQGRTPHSAASQALADEIRRELREIAHIVLD